ncbi:MAG: TonB-dependent receptor [Opitutaceae bacterium]|nr:TonB-dependent receptor [Opitutaceae bacterium]
MLIGSALPAIAQTHSTLPAGHQLKASIAGRVFNQSTARYVNNAHVAVKGTTLQTFTDQTGAYVLDGVEPGAVTVVVSFTNTPSTEATLILAANQRAALDLILAATGADGSVVRLDEFRVNAAREVDAESISAHEQRYSRNLKSVTSTDSLGEITQNNIGEFVKYLPGVGIEYQGSDIIRVTVRGLDSAQTEVTSDGLAEASVFADERENTRAPRLTQSSTVGIARIEVRKVPLPSDSANAVGGSINMVRRTAFEYARREINTKLSFNTNSYDLTLGKTGGPGDERTRKVRPSFDLSIVDPVNKNLGYTMGLGYSDVMMPWHYAVPRYNYGTAASLANPQPGRPSIYNPAMDASLLHQSYSRRERIPLSLRVDWRPVPALTLTPFASYTRLNSLHRADVRFQLTTGATLYNDSAQVLGTPGAGAATYVNQLESWRDEYATNTNAGLIAKWRQGSWQVEGAANASRSISEFKDTENGFFSSPSDQEGRNPSITNLTVNFLDLNWRQPGRYEVLDRNGVPVDWSSAANYSLRAATSRPRLIQGDVETAYLKVKRDFETHIPFGLELGANYKREKRDRKRMDLNNWTFLGADGVPNSADDRAGVIAADHYAKAPDAEYGYPAVEHLSMTKYYNLFKAHPEYFRYEDAISYRRSAENVNKLTETVKAIYVMGDTRLFANRVSLVGGVRYERSEGEGRGLLQTPTAVFQRNPDGSFVLVNGQRVRKPEAGAAGSLADARMIYHRNGATGRGMRDGYFPSLHASWNVTDNFAFKAAYASTQARPDFNTSLLPSTTVSANNNTDPALGSLGTVTIRNPNLKPWLADNYDGRLEYYLKNGYVAVGYYRKFIRDFVVTRLELLETLDEAAAVGLEPDYVGWSARTGFNAGNAILSGWEFETRHSLDSVLPKWARGFSLRGSLNLADPDGQKGGWGSMHRQKASAMLNYQSAKLRVGFGWNFEGRIDGAVTTLGGEPGQLYVEERSLFDATLEYRLAKRVSLFASGTNIFNAARTNSRETAHLPHWARLQLEATFGANYTLGVKASF